MSKYFFICFLLISNSIFSINGYIRICNKGAYLAKCYLQSRSAEFGFSIQRHDTGLFPVAQCATLNVPITAILNRLECKTLAFIAIYKSIFVQEFGTSIFNYCYEITGTTLNPHWRQTTC